MSSKETRQLGNHVSQAASRDPSPPYHVASQSSSEYRSLLAVLDSLLIDHWSLLATHCASLTIPTTSLYSLLSVHCSLPHCSLLTTHHLPVPTHYSLLTADYSVFTLHASHSLLTLRSLLVTRHSSLLTTAGYALHSAGDDAPRHVRVLRKTFRVTAGRSASRLHRVRRGRPAD